LNENNQYRTCNTGPAVSGKFKEERMKNLLKLSALAAVLVASATYASAATLQLGSYCSSCAAPSGDVNTGLNLVGLDPATFTPSGGIYSLGAVPGNLLSLLGTNPTFNVSPGTAWSGPLPNSSWVSSASTGGPVGTINPPQGFYIYETDFTASADVYSGVLNLWADDTAAVFLNGVQLIGFGTLGDDGHCANTAPTCVSPLATVSFSQLLLAGTNANVLRIVDVQAGNLSVSGQDPAGIDFNATLTSAVPEPSTLLMLGTGLMGGAGALFRRMRK
jgi:hypothetical protein